MGRQNSADTPIVDSVLTDLVARGEETGIQVAAMLHGKLVVDSWAGFENEATSKPVTGDTLFNIYSVGKAICATAVHMLVERTSLTYETRLADLWPEFGTRGKELITVRDVLTHRSGIPHMPEGVTPELMCDHEWMAQAIANLEPLAPPGEKALYQSMTFGWLVGEIVQRVDPLHRSIGQFIREEIADPLKADDLWIGLPESEHRRVARGVEEDVSGEMELPPLYLAAMPPTVALRPHVFQRPDVMSAGLGGVGGISNARSCVRFWAMLAQGGELDGVRLLSEERVRSFSQPRSEVDEPDLVIFGFQLPLSNAGFWLGGPQGPVAAAKHRHVICHPAAGNSIGFADMQSGLSVAICHNRMQTPVTREADNSARIADAVRRQLGID